MSSDGAKFLMRSDVEGARRAYDSAHSTVDLRDQFQLYCMYSAHGRVQTSLPLLNLLQLYTTGFAKANRSTSSPTDDSVVAR